MVDINEGVHQEGLKRSLNVPVKTKKGGGKNINPSDPTAGRNYASRVNAQAKKRMEKIRRNVAMTDMIEAVSRLKISNLPIGLRSKLIQRVMYYRGNTMYYRDFDLGRDFMLPYSLTAEDDQNIDFYGQYTRTKPMSFNGKSTENRNPKDGKKSPKDVYLGTISRIPVYDMGELEALMKLDVDSLEKLYNPRTGLDGKPRKNYSPSTAKDGKEWCQRNLCVIFRDYTNQLNEENVSRSVTQQAFIDMQAEVLPMLRTVMLKAAMPKLVKGDEGVVESLLAELDTIEASIIEGKTMIPVTAFQDLQEIDSKDAGRVVEVFAMMYESYGNIRKSFLGVPNDGAFKKNAHTLQDEQDMNSVSSNSILDDCYENYKESFDMVNRLFDENITVEIAGAVDNQKAASELKQEEKEAGNEEGGDLE